MLFRSEAQVVVVERAGALANREREKRHGARTYYNFNIRLEATNVCVASCLFCSFARLKPGDDGLFFDTTGTDEESVNLVAM